MILDINGRVLTNHEFWVQQYWMRKNLEAGMKVMDAENTTFFECAFNGEFDYPVCI